MEQNRFFRILWRINGIVFLAVILLIAGMILYGFIGEMNRRKTPPVVITNTQGTQQDQEVWTLGIPTEIDGNDLMYMPLISEKKEITRSRHMLAAVASSYGSMNFGPSRNILFINKSTREMNWLFKDNGQIIESIHLLSKRPYQREKDRMVEAVLYEVIRRDTNSDKKLNSDDLIDIGVSLPNGSMYRELLESVERVLGAIVLDGEELLLLYQSNGRGYASTIDLQKMTIKETKDIPTIDQNK